MPLSSPAALIPGLVLWQWEHTLRVRSETYRSAGTRRAAGGPPRGDEAGKVPNIRPQISQSGSRMATAPTGGKWRERIVHSGEMSIHVICPSR